MSATSCVDSDLALAEGTNLGGGSGRNLLNLLLANVANRVNHFHYQEQNEGNDQEIDDSHNQGTIVDINAGLYNGFHTFDFLDNLLL